MGLEALDKARRGPFVVLVEGAPVTLPDPANMSLRDTVNAIRFDGAPLFGKIRVPAWKSRAALAEWMAHYDLGTPHGVNRLLWLLDRYDSHLEWDLQVHAQADLGQLFRAREWRRLLNLIDHLPRHSWYSEAVANDPEHARMLAEARAKNPDDGPYTPPMNTWSPEVAALTDITDAVNRVRHAIIAVNSNGKPPPPPEPLPRPKSALTSESKKAEHRRRQASHQSLVARMLPKKAGPSS